jgi:hypothetical protein
VNETDWDMSTSICAGCVNLLRKNINIFFEIIADSKYVGTILASQIIIHE